MTRAIPAIVGLFLAGCVSTPQGSEARRLMALPGFHAAAEASPEWTVEALDSVARMEYELNRLSK